MNVNGIEYEELRLLGHGKGGYSYLVRRGGDLAVIKQIHHEPCSYYSFGNKLEAELRDYERLKAAGIRIPDLYAVDIENERILKEFIDGKTVFELIRDGGDASPYLSEVREMAELAKQSGLNIDYFPTNFVIRDDKLYYIDYECNEYSDKWSFESWGVKYWSRTPEFLSHLK